MKKYISYLLTLALLVPAFVSCTQERDFLSRKQKTHTVHFATSEPATRTGLSIEENMVKPDWRKTDLENIHFFEIDATNAAAPGTADKINLSDDNRTAHFKAAISDDMTIIVSPSEGDNGSKGAKSAGVSPFTFAAVVAQKPDKDAYTFVIPSEQYPDAETLKDPNAEFLVGYSRKSYPSQYDYDDVVVDLYFDRVAALGRLAISGFVGTGEKVKSVTITATGGMTGKATYPGDFTLGDKNKVNFTKVDEPLVLDYGDGVAAPTEGAFYAYFVAAPGEASITSIEVLTDQYKYTKTVAQGAKFTFSDEQLLNIDFVLSEDIAEAVTPDNKTWYKASVLEDGIDYIIVSEGMALQNNDGTIDAVALEPHDGIIALDSAVDPTIVWKATAVSGEENTQYGTHRLSNNGYDIHRGSGNNASPTLEKDVSSDNVKRTIWSYDGKYFWNISIYTSGSSTTVSTYYLFYDSSWKQGTSNQKNTDLYETRPPIEVSFASAEAKYDLDNGEWTVAIPELTAPEGATITYSSSNEDIATVDADGTVTPKAAGSVQITATVESNDEYQGGSAYYDLTVTTSKITTWYKVEEFVPGQTYLLVSHGYTLSNDNGSIAAYNAEINSDEIQFNAPSTMVWTAEADGNYCNLANNGKYLIYQSSTSSGDIKIGDKSSTPDYNRWSYSVSEDRIVLIAQSRTLYWSDSRENWNVSSNTGGKYVSSIYTNIKPLKSRNLAFSKESITVVLGQTPEKPELSGMTEGISYSSFDTSIATVDGEGNVTPKKVGTTTITASADATDEYAAGSASYKLTVSDGSVVFFVKVTELSELNTSDSFIITNNADNNAFIAVWDGSNIIAADGNTKAFTLTPDGKIVDDGTFEACKFTLEAKGAKYNMYFSGVERYIYPSGSTGLSSKVKEESPSEDQAIAFSVSGGNWTLIRTYSSNSRYFMYNTPSSGKPYFQTGTTGTLHLFKLEGSGGDTPPTPEKQERNLSFGTDNFSCILGQSATFPTLSGVTDGVSYSSSDGTVATVNASGVVTAKAAGTTIIKAEAPESGTYLAGSAQYTLTVEDTSPSSNKTFTKVSAFTSGKKYIIVDGTNALMNNSGEDALYSVSGKISGNTLTVSSSEVDAIEWTVVSNAAHTTQGDFTIKNGEYYLTRANTTNENNDVTLSESVTAYTVWTLDGSNLRQKNSSGQYTFYLHVVNSNRWTANTQTAPNNITIYEESAGGDPTPTTATYTKVNSITSGATYLIVSHTDALALVGNGNTADGNTNFISVTPSTGVITGTASEFENCEAVITEESSGAYSIYFKKLGQYLYYTSSSSGLTYGGTHNSSNDFSLSTVASGNYAGSFLFTKSSKYLYYNGTFFKIGGSGSELGVHLYKKDL